MVPTFWTQDSTTSKAVLEEAATAQADKKLVDVRLDDSPMPYGFGETQYVNLRDWDGTAAHPSFQRVIRALRDKLAAPTTEFARTRLRQSSPIEMVAQNGRLAIRDAPAHVAPAQINPADLEARIAGLQQSILSTIRMCGDKSSFQLPGTLDHCLEALRLAASTDPVTWYALDDAKCLLTHCMEDSFAAETWNAVIYAGVAGIVARIDEIKPLLQPLQIDPETQEEKPFAPEPVVRAKEVPDVLALADKLKTEFLSEAGEEVLDDNTRQSLERTTEAISDAAQSHDTLDKTLPRYRRAVRSLTFLTGGLIAAISTGVMVNLLTSPTAAATLATRLKPIYEALLQFFI